MHMNTHPCARGKLDQSHTVGCKGQNKGMEGEKRSKTTTIWCKYRQTSQRAGTRIVRRQPTIQTSPWIRPCSHTHTQGTRGGNVQQQKWEFLFFSPEVAEHALLNWCLQASSCRTVPNKSMDGFRGINSGEALIQATVKSIMDTIFSS